MFSYIYDALMADIDYTEFKDFLSKHLTKQQTIIDAGCGSGHLFLELVKSGYQMIGIDNDSDMLKLAKEKLVLNHLNAELYDHDLNDPIPIKVDAIISLFDVLNYFKGIKKVLKHLMNAINDNGFLIFDVYKEEILEAYKDYSERDTHPFEYLWDIKVSGNTITHYVTVSKNTNIVKQYIKPKTYYENIIKDLGYSFEYIDGIDERKNYYKVHKKIKK